jgi:hypothetical protein
VIFGPLSSSKLVRFNQIKLSQPAKAWVPLALWPWTFASSSNDRRSSIFDFVFAGFSLSRGKSQNALRDRSIRPSDMAATTVPQLPR